jgi:hypothetical protein
MRRTYISPEFTYDSVNGTFNMIEQSSFFGSKMMDIEDYISISNQSIIYYQTAEKEQLDLSSERSSPSLIYDSSDNKLLNHTIVIDDSQPQYQKEKNTKWIININIHDILREYLFAILKQYRTFEGVKNVMTIGNDINTSIYNYIEYNIIPKYKFTSIDMYISYNDIHNQNILRYKNNFNKLVISNSNLLKKIQTDT